MTKFAFIVGAFVSSIIAAAPAQAGRTAIDGNGGSPTVLSGYCDFNGQDCVTEQLGYQVSFDNGKTFFRTIDITGNGLLTFGGSANFTASDPTGAALRDKILAANDPFYYEDDRRDPALTDYGLNLISAGQNSRVDLGAFYQSARLNVSGNVINAEWFTCESTSECQTNPYLLTLRATPTGFIGEFDFISGRGGNDIGYVVNGEQRILTQCQEVSVCEFFLPAIITEVTAAVPEPASWAMMICGFGLVGGALRRRTTRSRVALA